MTDHTTADAVARLREALHHASRVEGIPGTSLMHVALYDEAAELNFVDGADALVELPGVTGADLRALLSRLAECEADAARVDWLEANAKPHHAVIVCGSEAPGEEFMSLQRIDQFHNPHKVLYCHESRTLRGALDTAMRDDDDRDDGWAVSDGERGEMWDDATREGVPK